MDDNWKTKPETVQSTKIEPVTNNNIQANVPDRLADTPFDDKKDSVMDIPDVEGKIGGAMPDVSVVDEGADEETLFAGLVEKIEQPVKEVVKEEKPQNLLQNIKTKAPEAKATLKNTLMQKVGVAVGAMRGMIAKESFEFNIPSISEGTNGFPKIDIYHKGEYLWSTNSHRRVKDAVKRAKTVLSDTGHMGKVQKDTSPHTETLRKHLANGIDLTTIKGSFDHSRNESITESAAPGQEEWVKANKQRFIDEYGEKKGLEVLYAKSWEMHKSKK